MLCYVILNPEDFKVIMNSNLPSANQKQRRVRVLIADDSPQVRHDLHQFLELTGEMEVVAEAADGQEAVSLAVKLSPDAIVMDLAMPHMDGFEATRQIKAQQPAPRIVILSMYADPENVQQARAVGADEFVVKTADSRILIDAILGRNDSPNPTNL
jgi:DNA-binding NarL/FixJ family response regulator